MKYKKILLILVFLFSIVACHKKERNFDAVIVGLEGSPSTLDPRLAADAYSERVNSLVYNGIFTTDRHGRIIPDLAEKWEVRNNSITVHLKKGVVFQNGKPLTSRDVKYTLESILKMPSPYQSNFKEIKDIITPDKHTVILKLKKFEVPILTALVVGIVPYGDSDKNFKPIGTGPYIVKEFIRGEKIVLIRNKKYFKGSPRIKKIIFRVIPDDTTRVMELLNGGVDLLQNSIPPDMLPEVKKSPKLEVKVEPGVNVSYLGFNLKDKYLKDFRVRKAIAMAIDRKSIITHLLGGLAEEANSILAPTNWAYAAVTTPSYDPDVASKLLDNAGYKKNKDGFRFQLEYKTSTNRLRRRIAEVIADQLEKIGIKVKVRSYEFGTFFSDIRKGNFQLYSLTWVGITDPDILYYAFDSKSIPPQGANRNFYMNPIFDKLVEEAREITDEAKRKRLYAQAQKILAKDLPVLPLWYHYNIMAYRKGLQGVEILPGGEYRFLANAWWEKTQSR